MISLSWAEVNAWRLSQQNLLPRTDLQNLIAAATRLGGIHAQLTSSAELSLAARVEGLTPDIVQNALWRDRTLLKTWVMRGTLHLVQASELPLFVAARSAVPIHRPPSYYTYHGVTPDELEAILEGIPQVLSGEPMLREQLATELAERSGMPNLRQVLLSGWGALLKPSAFRGDLCFGPSQGQNVTFVKPSLWIGAWKEGAIEPQEALKEMARRYLNAYGPANAADFSRWWGYQQPAQAKKVFRALREELVEVDVEGWRAWALASTLEQMQKLEPVSAVRLLPQFDAFTVGVSRECAPILSREYKGRVYRPQGWISAVVLLDGRIEGTWEHERRGEEIAFKLSMFASPTSEVESSFQTEAARLGEFLGAEVDLIYL